MGLKSFFNSLFEHKEQDNPIPTTLMEGTHKNSVVYNNIDYQQSRQTESTPPQEVNKPEDTKADPTEDDKPQNENKTFVNTTYNLIILDESGSMSDVRYKTIDGCNKTLASIRNIARRQPDTKQFVSIFCFDTTSSRYIFKNMPIENTRNLTREDYLPNSCTPLYDAIGYTVTQLRQVIGQADAVGVVTIITDGYENASQHWNHSAVVELINSLKKHGWVFTFIGANIDVERTAKGLGIDSHISFQQNNEGMDKMFQQERRSRRAYNEKVFYLKGRPIFSSMTSEDRNEVMGSMNSNFFIEDERVAPDIFNGLKEGEIFVFSTDIHGQHKSESGEYAMHFAGTVEGQAEGIQGRCYAIPTEGNTFEELKAAIVRFTDYVVTHPQNKFMLTAIGCGSGNGGYKVSQIAPLFRQAYSFGNVYVPASFLPYISRNTSL